MYRGSTSLVLLLASLGAHATLLGRAPATPGGADYQAYYDDVLNVTWVANANLSRTSGYDADGLMNWSQANAWILSLNSVRHLSNGNWRLPSMDEMDHMYGQNVVSTSHPSPFINVMGSYIPDAQSWLPEFYFLFNFTTGAHQILYMRRPLAYAWAVRTGDFDADGDTVAELEDNCTLVVNPDQLDADADGYGNACDGDLNNSGMITSTDFNLFRSCLNLPASRSALCAAADMNGSGMVTTQDFSLMRGRINTPSGPSGLHR